MNPNIIKNKVLHENILFNKALEHPKPNTYFSIGEPEPYNFPLGEFFLENVELLERDVPESINERIQEKFVHLKVKKMRMMRCK
jgi:hypothetical protein